MDAQTLSRRLLSAVVVSSSLAIAWIIYVKRDYDKEGAADSEARDDASTAKRSWWAAVLVSKNKSRPCPRRRRSRPTTRSTTSASAYVANRLDAHWRLKNIDLNRGAAAIDMIKLQRWERLIPKLTMKRPMYDNILMHDPDGGLLCTISQKKANWYVRKGLAEWKDESMTSIRLRFRPNKDATTGKDEQAMEYYNQSHKENQCVACGRQDRGYMRFYIVPYCYRTLFPTSHKSHMPHDVVLLCPACQLPAQRASQKRQTQLERPFVNSDGPKYRTFPQIRHLRKLAGALLSHPGLPPSRRNQYMEEIGGFLGTDSVSPEQLEAVLQMEEKVLNPDYVPPCELLVQALLQPPTDESSTVAPDDDSESSSSMDGAFEALEMFVREWRRHFVTTMRPRHLPQGWSVDSPVRCQGSTAVSASSASTALSSDV